MHILTFDIEDWFHTFDKAYYGKVDEWEGLSTHVVGNTERILDFLSAHQLKATFFWVGWEAERHPALVKKMAANGHEIAAHSFYHRKINDLGREAFRKDTEKTIKLLEDITGNKVYSFRAPGMTISKNTFWALEILNVLGIKYDSSVVAVRNGWLPDTPFVFKQHGVSIKELPVPAIPFMGMKFIFSSSGYFRIAPFGWAKQKMSRNDYMISYFHPRDFDPDIHRYISNNPYFKLRYRVGANSCMKKLVNLTNAFDFINISEAVQKIDWDKMPVVSV